jgi:hypothetical protein
VTASPDQKLTGDGVTRQENGIKLTGDGVTRPENGVKLTGDGVTRPTKGRKEIGDGVTRLKQWLMFRSNENLFLQFQCNLIISSL